MKRVSVVWCGVDPLPLPKPSQANKRHFRKGDLDTRFIRWGKMGDRSWDEFVIHIYCDGRRVVVVGVGKARDCEIFEVRFYYRRFSLASTTVY